MTDDMISFLLQASCSGIRFLSHRDDKSITMLEKRLGATRSLMHPRMDRNQHLRPSPLKSL